MFNQSRRAFVNLFGLAPLARHLELNPAAAAAQPDAAQNVHDFGATGDGKTLETASIQRAVDACSQSGGGCVYFPAGTYLSGTIALRSNVWLYLDAGATLLGSTQLEHFRAIQPQIRSYTDQHAQHSLIYAEDAERIGIAGRGISDGQGAAFKDPSYRIRPYLLRIVNCRNVEVAGITLKNSPMWVQHYLLDRPCRYVTVTNCVLRSRSNAFKLRTESVGDLRISASATRPSMRRICQPWHWKLWMELILPTSQ